MTRVHAAGGLLVLAALVGATPYRGQEWSPPSRQMPQMPASADLAGGWRGSLGSWFNGLGVSLAGLRAEGDGGTRPRFVRFSFNLRPVEQWSDRNGDGRADLVEVYRNGALAFRLVDADYDGTANSLRAYDTSGSVAREERY
jgi:hypothetical protein